MIRIKYGAGNHTVNTFTGSQLCLLFLWVLLGDQVYVPVLMVNVAYFKQMIIRKSTIEICHSTYMKESMAKRISHL